MGFVKNAVSHVFGGGGKANSGGGGARPYQNELLQALTGREILAESIAQKPEEPELGTKKKKKKGRKSLFVDRNTEPKKKRSGVGISL